GEEVVVERYGGVSSGRHADLGQAVPPYCLAGVLAQVVDVVDEEVVARVGGARLVDAVDGQRVHDEVRLHRSGRSRADPGDVGEQARGVRGRGVVELRLGGQRCTERGALGHAVRIDARAVDVVGGGRVADVEQGQVHCRAEVRNGRLRHDEQVAGQR